MNTLTATGGTKRPFTSLSTLEQEMCVLVLSLSLSLFRSLSRARSVFVLFEFFSLTHTHNLIVDVLLLHRMFCRKLHLIWHDIVWLYIYKYRNVMAGHPPPYVILLSQRRGHSLFISLSIYLSIYLFIYLSIYLSVCLYVSIHRLTPIVSRLFIYCVFC